MANKIKHTLLSTLVIPFLIFNSNAKNEVLPQTETSNIYNGIDEYIDGETTSDLSMSTFLKYMLFLGVSSIETIHLYRKMANHVIVPFIPWEKDDPKLKKIFKDKLFDPRYYEVNELYKDIYTYKVNTSDDQNTIIKDAPRSFLTGVSPEDCKKLQPIIQTVLQYSHGKTKIPYYQGFNFVCLGLAYLLYCYNPNLTQNEMIKSCTYLYFSILPDLKKYSSIFSNYINDIESHWIMNDVLQKLLIKFKDKNISENDIKDYVRVLCSSTFCSYGTNGIKTSSGEYNYSSVGSTLVKALILRAFNIITSDSLEKLMRDVLYSQSYEFINSYPKH